MKKRFVIRQNVCKGSANLRQYQIKTVFYFIVEMPPTLFKGSANRRQYQIKTVFYFIVEMPPTLLYKGNVQKNLLRKPLSPIRFCFGKPFALLW